MKTILGLAIGTMTVALSIAGMAQTALSPTETLTVFGDSSLHKWKLATKNVATTYALDGDASTDIADAIKAAKVKNFEVRIAVADLKSGESGLDKNMRAAMRTDKYPEVVYKLAHYELAKSTDSTNLLAKTTGDLTIAGRTQTVRMDVEFALGSRRTAAKGSFTLNMSDYGIKPPTLMLGTIKVRDPVTIRFDVSLKPADAAPMGGS
jgi:polyisoprenoid-binding protein YceI